MSIIRINELPEGSGSLSSDDIFIFMDNPSSGGITKKIPLSNIIGALGGGSGILINNAADNNILTSNGSGSIDAESSFKFDNVSKTTTITSPITDGDTGPWYILTSYGDGSSLSKSGRFVGRRLRGTEASPLPAQSGDTMAVFRADSINTSGTIITSSRILMRADGTAQAGNPSIPSRIEISTSSGPATTDNNLILYSNGYLYHNGYMTIDNGLSSPTPIFALGTVSGNTAISYAVDRQIQTLTLNGTSVNFTKGTGWNTSNRSYDLILHITVTSTTSVAFDGTFVTDFFSTLPVFSAGTYIVLIRNFGASNIHCYYIGKKV